MRCRSALLALVVLLVLSCIGIRAQDDGMDPMPIMARIDSISPSQGSCGGGTRLALQGAFTMGMDDMTMVVYIGPWPCEVIHHLSSESVVTCETSEGDPGPYQVTMMVAAADGSYSQATYNYFTYQSWLTPTLRGLVPAAGSPGSQVQLYGDSVSQLENDCYSSNAFEDATYCLSGILFQDYRCKFNTEDVMSTIDFPGQYVRYNIWDAYALTCSLPDPVDGGTLDQTTFPGLGVAKSVNVTVRFEATMQGGMPAIQRSAYMADVHGWPYMFQIFATVESVSPATGSIAGGTTVTIKGRGFPTLALQQDRVGVRVAGVPCAVQTSNYTTLTCVTGALPGSYVAPSAINGLYPGSRGLEIIEYQADVNGFNNLWKLNTTLTLANTNGVARIAVDRWETNVWSSAASSRSKTFFVAPTTGSYTFLMAADDYGQLNGTWYLSNGTLVSQQLANVTAWADVDNWVKYPSQQSAPVSLLAGQAVLLEAAYSSPTSTAFQQVGVIMPSASPAWASRAEVQSLSLTGQHAQRVYQFKYSWPIGSAVDYVYNVTLTATQAWLLTDPRVGVNLTLDGTRTAVFPITASPATAVSAIKSALGVSSSGNVGVAKFLSAPGTLTFQIAVNRSSQANLTLSAQLSVLSSVTLPVRYAPQNFSMPDGCTWFNPALADITPAGSSYPAAAPPPALDDSVLAAGASVSAAQITLASVATPSGTWMLVGPNLQADPQPLQYNQAAVNVSQAFRAATGVQPSGVTLTAAARDGAYMSVVWTVTAPWNVNNSIPPVTAVAGPDAPAGVVVSTNITSNATDPLGGVLWVQLGSYCDSVSIDIVRDSEGDIADKLRALPYMNRKALRAVQKSGGTEWGWGLKLTWEPTATPGDIPQLTITSAQLTGTNPILSLTTIVNGTTDFIMAPIPAEFLRLAVPVSGTIDVVVNGVPSSCVSFDGPSGCTFTPDATITPAISSVTPTTLSFVSVSSMTLTITGTGFSATGSVVTVGRAPCVISAASGTSITCDVAAADVTAGSRAVNVLVDNIGYATGAMNVTVRTLRVDAISPATVSGLGTLVNITGSGFDGADCGNNQVTLDDVFMPIVACGATWIQVLVNDSQVIADEVSAGETSSTGMSMNLTVMVQDAAAVVLDSVMTPAAMTVGDTASPALVALPYVTPSTLLPGSGFTLTADFDSAATAAAVSALWLFPLPPDTFSLGVDAQQAALAAGFAARRPCGTITPDGSVITRVTCEMGTLPNGGYLAAAATSDGTVLVLPAVQIQVGMYIDAVSPAAGSVGGGTTLTITGRGFNVVNASANVVLLPVPVSTTFLNGLIVCDVASANATQITCLTRRHYAADASATDAMGTQVQPIATMPDQITVVACDPGLSDILKLQCWSLGNQSAKAQSTNPAATKFAYDWAHTPTIVDLDSEIVQPGQSLGVTGAQLANVVEVRLVQGTTVRATCAITSVTATRLACDLPATLPAGGYGLVLVTDGGELSVDLRDTAVLNVVAYMVSVTNAAGSLAGGTPLTLTINGTTWNATSPDKNVVLVGGAPCVVSAVSGGTLTCATPSLQGRVRAEYWNLAPYSWGVFPDIMTFTNPVLTRLEQGAELGWAYGSPAPSVNPDFFVARFTFYLQIVTAGQYKFYLGADDNAKLYVNEQLLLGTKGAATTTLSPGHAKIQMTFVEWSGYTSLSLQWDAGLGSQQSIPWFRIYPYAPGEPVPITATINGMPALYGCPDASVLIPTTPAVVPTPEAQGNVAVSGPLCAFVYSSYLTPTLTAALPALPITIASNLTLTGQLLSTSASDFAITVAGVACSVVGVQDLGNNTQTVTCSLPAIAAGKWPLVVKVAGYGATRPLLSTTSTAPDMSITYGVGVRYVDSLVLPGVPDGPYSSYLGGQLVQISGWGFAAPGNAQGKTMSIQYASGASGTSPYPGKNQITVVSATATSMTLAVQRVEYRSGSALWLPSFGYSAVQQNSSYYVNVWDATLPAPVFSGPNKGSSAQGYLWVTYHTFYTPKVVNVTSTLTGPSSGGTLSLSWSLRVGSAAGLSASATTASLATVQLQAGTDVYDCTSPTLSYTNLTTSSLTENLTCTLPAYLPAATYTVWVCMAPLGCGYATTAINVPLTVTSVTPTTGSVAGGLELTVSGSGFSGNASQMAALFGPVKCAVTFSSATQFRCMLGQYASYTKLVGTLYLSRPGVGLPTNIPVAGVNFTFDPALTPNVTGVSPSRGSTAGGTAITISGVGFLTGLASTDVTVAIGPNATCTNVVVVSSTTITCTTAAPTYLVAAPLQITVTFAGIGAAWNPSKVSYQYANLWSRHTTWGGNPPPVEGDSVFIPANTTVILDVSPPVLGAVVLEGNLYWDDSLPASTEVHLQAYYILLKGGNLTIGTSGSPYPSKARITLHGLPTTIELPQYGSKCIGIRDGNLVMHGQHKVPTWTLMATTADVGATTIQIQGQVNWVPGDQIAIASSSFFANETDTATIVSNTFAAGTNTTTLLLSQPLQYTHLGVTVPVPGDAAGRSIEMRAEVVVLSRNIVIQGDDTSADFMFGGQIMLNTPRARARAQLQLEQVELTHMGQAFRLGRYTIHWHMQGDMEYNSWLKGVAIHHTFNRAATIHGTHRVITQDCVAYDIMGHAWFLEDGIETGNIYQNNVGMLVRRSDALLITDTTPAVFWVTHPNNTYINNRACGSTNGYGFWYRFLSHPEGPSFTTSVCPKHTPMAEFTNNVAHSNMFYGLRVHPEFLPMLNPCGTDPDDDGTYIQVPATFNGLLSYKNGMKGAIATQVGAVRFANMTLADNGGGPRAHVVTGKDNGANYEMTWIVDDRNRADTNLFDMAGLYDSLIVSKTAQGNVGTAGRWNSSRKITGVITHSPAEFHVKHTALGVLSNVTFVNYSSSAPVAPNFSGAIESCGKCKSFQGGATTFTQMLTFIQPGQPHLTEWSWGHQGVYQDLDGSLLNNLTLPADLLASAPFPVGRGVANVTWHSGVDSNLFDPTECVYVAARPTSNNGVFCANTLSFRRVMLHDHLPNAITFRPLLVTTAGGAATNKTRYNGTSLVYFQHYNEDGYQFTVPTKRDYYLHWQTEFRVDATTLTLHKPDPLDASGWVTLTQRLVQKKETFSVNSVIGNLTAVPAASTGITDGACFYNKTFAPDPWWYGNHTYNATAATVYIAGRVPHASRYRVSNDDCPPGGCNSLPDQLIDMRDGLLRWSDNATWTSREGGKPKPGENVTIPFGWNLLVDENPIVFALVIQGNVSFDTTKPIVLTATYVVVMGQGVLAAGSPAAPFNGSVTIVLNGTRQTPDWAITNDLNLGSKVLAAVRGGRIELHGRRVAQRWTRLAAAASAGATTLTLSQPQKEWPVGGQLLLTSTSWNPWQAETRGIVSVSADGLTIGLDAPLRWDHSAKVMDIPGAANGAFDMRAEVALVSSNVRVAAMDGFEQSSPGGEMFGCRVIASGAALMRISNAHLDYCGQAGLLRSALKFQNMAAIDPAAFNISRNGAGTGPMPNPSYVANTAITNSMDGGLEVIAAANNPVSVTGNVLYISYDRHTVMVSGIGNTVSGNLALGTIKDMTGKSSFDKDMPSTFAIASSNNLVTNNVAAGGERVGFMYKGIPCSSSMAALAQYGNNSAHSYLVGAWLKSSDESDATGCTAMFNFTTYLNWDFGIISTDGITTDVELTGINIADSKFANILILRKAQMTERSQVTLTSTTLVGISGSDVCGLCRRRVDASNMDPGCHPKLARTSYNQQSPFTPVKGFLGSVFALKFTPGPEPYPWDGLKGYETIYGVTYMRGTTLANFQGDAGCEGKYQTYALGNHQKAPEAFHPVFMSGTNLYNVDPSGLMKLYGPDPAWRSEDACDVINWSRATQQIADNDSIQSQINDASVIQLTCTGPKHVSFRDIDGSLTGKPGSTLMGHNSGARSFPFDLGTPLVPGPCQYSPGIQGYQCLPNSTNFELDAALKPSPTPPAGIFGDPQHFVLESRDSDSEDRNFSPVFFNVSGVVELATPAMDHEVCFAYKCQKRQSTFWTYLPSGHTVNISFTGTPSRVLRYHWPYADASAEIILVINYQSTPNRRFSWTASRGRINPLAVIPAVGDGTPHGSFYWDQASTLFYLKMVGGSEAVEVRTENALMVSQSLAVSFDQFYDVREMFLSNLAFLLGIPLSRIQVVKIVPGSTNVDYMLYEPPEAAASPIAEKYYDTSNTMDAETKAAVSQLPPSEQAAWVTDASTASPTDPSAPAGSPAVSPAVSGKSLVDVAKAFMTLPDSIGNITVLASSILPGGALVDPALLASIYTALGIDPDRAVDTPIILGPGDSGSTAPSPSGTTDGGLGSGSGTPSAPSDGSSPNDERKKHNAIIAGTLAGVLGAAALAGIIAAFVMKKRRAQMAGYDAVAGGVHTPGRAPPRLSPRASPRVTPLPSHSGASDSNGHRLSTIWLAEGAAAGAAGTGLVAAAGHGSPRSKLGGKGGTPTDPPGTPTRPNDFSITSRPDSQPGSPGAPLLPPPPAHLAMGVAPGIGSRGGAPLAAFGHTSPHSAWDAATQGRAGTLPALRPAAGAGGWQGHNVMVSGSGGPGADMAPDANAPPPRLPGAPSMRGPDAAAAAEAARNAAPF